VIGSRDNVFPGPLWLSTALPEAQVSFDKVNEKYVHILLMLNVPEFGSILLPQNLSLIVSYSFKNVMKIYLRIHSKLILMTDRPRNWQTKTTK